MSWSCAHDKPGSQTRTDRGRPVTALSRLFEGSRRTHREPARPPAPGVSSVWVVQTIGKGESVDAHVTVEDHLVVHGKANGGIHIPGSSSLEVHGVVSGGITVDPGGHAAI